MLRRSIRGRAKGFAAVSLEKRHRPLQERVTTRHHPRYRAYPRTLVLAAGLLLIAACGARAEEPAPVKIDCRNDDANFNLAE